MLANHAPADLVQWNPLSNMNEDVRKTQQHQNSSSNHFASSLNPLAPVFLPVKTTSSFDPGKSETISTVKDTKHSTTTSNQRDTKGKVRKGPSKRQPIPLPGQNVMTKYLLPKKITTPPISQSMSLPTQENSSTSEEDVLSPVPEPETLQVASNKPQEPKIYISSQRTLFDFTFFKPHAKISPEDPDVFGHVPQQIDSARTFRIILQNPNGIKPSVTEPDFMFSLHLCHEVGVGAICLAETNVNWHHYQHSAALHRCLHRNWSSSRFQTSVPEEKFLGNYQPGGTTTVITDRWTSRVTKSGADPFGLGRWSYMVLGGKSNINICIITAYKVCNDKSTGPKTAYQQQKRHLAALFHQSNIIVSVDPFKQFVLDLQSWISSIQEDGTQIILCLDNNEELLQNEGQLVPLPPSPLPVLHKTHDGRLETLACSVGLVDVLQHQHPLSGYPATYNRGRKRIDLILVSASLLSAVKSSGILPYNSIFQGDHHPCYIDIDADDAFGGKTAPIAPPCQRCLQQLDHRGISKKVSDLQRKDPTQWREEDYVTYERLDKLITESMLYAERTVSSRFTKTWEWSPVMLAAVYAERFWRLALKKSRGRSVSDDLFNRTRILAGIPKFAQPLSLQEILQCLTAARQSRKALQKDSHTLRQNYLTGLASALVLKRAPYLGTDPKYDEK